MTRPGRGCGAAGLAEQAASRFYVPAGDRCLRRSGHGATRTTGRPADPSPSGLAGPPTGQARSSTSWSVSTTVANPLGSGPAGRVEDHDGVTTSPHALRPEHLLRRGVNLESATLARNVVGIVVLAVAAVAARSVALAGFGLDEPGRDRREHCCALGAFRHRRASPATRPTADRCRLGRVVAVHRAAVRHDPRRRLPRQAQRSRICWTAITAS